MEFLTNPPVIRTMVSTALVLLVVGGCSHVSRFAKKERPAVTEMVDPFQNRSSEAIVVAPRDADGAVVQTSAKTDTPSDGVSSAVTSAWTAFAAEAAPSAP